MSLLDLIQEAERSRWCVDPGCTTCGALRFRRALRDRFPTGAQLANELGSQDLEALQVVANWDGALRLALGEVSSPDQMNRILAQWLPRLPANVRVADVVLFYFVRRGAVFAPMSTEMSHAWCEACRQLAIETEDESLVESLLYTLGADYLDNPTQRSLVERLAPTSRRVARARQLVAHGG